MSIYDTLKEGPIIIDDLMPDYLVEKFQQHFYEYAHFSIGNLHEGTSEYSNEWVKEKKLDDTLYEQFQLSTNYVFAPKNIILKEYYHLYMLPLSLVCLRLGINFAFDRVFRCKANLQFRAPESSRGKFNFPHRDVEDVKEGGKMITALFYVNDCDGDTYLFNEKLEWDDFDKFKDLTIKKQISPKQGRIVLFDAEQFHAGSNPIESDFRMVINYNFSPFIY